MLENALTISDLKRMARRRVPKMFFDYADSGAWTEETYRANESDFAKILLRQRVLVDMTDRNLGSEMIGEPVSMPVALAPTGLCGMQHADGEILAAQAAEAFGVPFCLSTMSICSIEDVAAQHEAAFWFQLYVMRDRGFIESLIDRAKAAGCSALVLTLDLQILGQRHKDLRNGLSAPPKWTPKHAWQLATRPLWCLDMLGTKRHGFGNIVGHAQNVGDLSSLASWTKEQFDPRLSWEDVDWIKERWGGKLILKGILDPEDARWSLDCGADAIIVSNHGGRQLDGARSSISALPGIVDAVGDRIEVHMDGGVRSGQDVLQGGGARRQGRLDRPPLPLRPRRRRQGRRDAARSRSSATSSTSPWPSAAGATSASIDADILDAAESPRACPLRPLSCGASLPAGGRAARPGSRMDAPMLTEISRRGVIGAGAALLASTALPRLAGAAGPKRLVVAADSEPRQLNPAIVASNGVFFISSKIIEPLAEASYERRRAPAAARHRVEGVGGRPDDHLHPARGRDLARRHALHLGRRGLLGHGGLEAAAEHRPRRLRQPRGGRDAGRRDGRLPLLEADAAAAHRQRPAGGLVGPAEASL